MKNPSVLAAAVLALSVSFAQPARSQTDPVSVLAEKLRNDKSERRKAAKAIEDFLLNPDSTGKRFVASDADPIALGAVARQWAGSTDVDKLAALLIVAEHGSNAEPRLRSALTRWTGPAQIRSAFAADSASAFLADAQDQAIKVLSDPRVLADLSIEVNNAASVPVPGGPAALERARQLRERGAGVGAGVFGPDKKSQDLNGGGDARSALKATEAAHKPGAEPQASATFVKNASAATTHPGANAPGAQLPRSQGRPDGIAVPAPNGAGGATAGGKTPAPAVAPNDGRVVPKEVSAWERVKESVSSPLSDAYGFTFAGLEPSPVSFRLAPPAFAYAQKAPGGSFTTVTFYGHGAPGYMTVGEWGGDAGDISNLLKGKMKASSTVELKGCNTSSIGGASVNPARGLSHLVRRVMYFSVPYLTGDRSEASREQLENDWDSDLARDVSIKLRGVKVCGFQTFGLVASRIPVVGTLMGNREATDSNAIGGSKACYHNGVEAE